MVPISSAYPLITALLAAALLHEQLTTPRVLGMVMIMAGVLIITRS